MTIADQKVAIVTPCSRPDNLFKMLTSIPKECTWVVVFDKDIYPQSIHQDITIISKTKSIYGNSLRNLALEYIDADWFYFLDDDNIIHEDWWSIVSEIKQEDLEGYNMISWGQLSKDGDLRLKPTKRPDVGNIDTACFMVRKTNHRWKEDIYEADGIFASKHQPYVVDKCISYYNALK